MRWLLRFLRGIQALIGLVFLALLLLVLYDAFRGPSIESGSVLVVDLEGSYVEAAEPALASRLLRLTRNGPVSLLGLVSMLDKAGRDQRLAAVVLRIRDLDVGWGKAQEIRAAIERMEQRGRRTIAYLESEGFASNIEYYIATAADEVYAPPGVQAPVGLAAEYFFLGGVWPKLGIEIRVDRIGRYKTFADFVAAEKMSDAHREVANSLLDSVLGQYVSDVEARRHLGARGLEGVFADAGAPTSDLVERGVFDGVTSLDEFLVDRLDDPTRVDAATYLGVDAGDVGIEPVARFALVYGSGPVVLGDAGFSATGGPLLASETVSRALREAAEDPDVKAILFRIDSPGGSALASEIVWRAVRQAAAKHPVIVSFSDVAASGGYYIASAADTIVSNPGTLTGSIGVLSIRPAVGDLLTRLGIGFDSATRGEHADLLLGTRLPSPESWALVERGVEEVYQRFVARVAEGRGLDPERVDALGRGRVWTGAQAAERGLVDAVGDFHAALLRAKRAAGVAEDADVELIAYPRAPGFLAQLTGGLGALARRGLVEYLPSGGLAALGDAGEAALRAAARSAKGPLLLSPVAVEIH
jgi:protease-4